MSFFRKIILLGGDPSSRGEILTVSNDSPSGSEVHEDERSARRPSLIIGGALILVLILGTVLYAIFSDSGTSSIVVFDPVKGVNGIEFDIETASERPGSEWSGTAAVEVFFEDQEEPVYRGEASIDDDRGSHNVIYSDFVWGNGDYRIKATADGRSNQAYFRIGSVADDITVEWEGRNMNFTKMRAEHAVNVAVGMEFSGSDLAPGEDPQSYMFSGTVTTPEGRIVNIESGDYPNNMIEYSQSIEHYERGSYRLTGTLTNQFCHLSSPYRTLRIEEDEGSYLYDASPFAVLGENRNLDLVNGSATVQMDASGSWDDSSIESYRWVITGGDVDEEISGVSPQLNYTFTQPASYYVSLTIVDDQGNISDQNAAVSTISIKVE